MSSFAHPAPYGINVIKRILPHRYPFLLVDGITELREDGVRGFKNLSANEEVFQGHFPQEAVYPGVLIIETVAQVGACWILSRHENLGKTAYLMTVESAKFRKPAVPGHRLDVNGTITNLKSRTGRLTSEVHIDGVLIAEVTVTFAFQKREATANGS